MSDEVHRCNSPTEVTLDSPSDRGRAASDGKRHQMRRRPLDYTATHYVAAAVAIFSPLPPLPNPKVWASTLSPSPESAFHFRFMF